MRLSALTLAIALACASPAPTPIRIAVVVRDDFGEPVANAHVWLDGHEVGATDATGRIVTDRSARHGDATAATIACPPGRRARTPTRTIVLRPLRTTTGKVAPLEVAFVCMAITATAPVVVVATGPGNLSFPVRVGEDVVAQTEATGVAHMLVEATPGTVLRVRIDTSARADLRPASPTLTVPVDEPGAILLVAQHFDRTRSGARGARSGILRQPKPTDAPRRPYRIH